MAGNEESVGYCNSRLILVLDELLRLSVVKLPISATEEMPVRQN